VENTPSRFMEPRVPSDEIFGHVSRPSRKRFAMAFAVAASSDVLSLWTELVPPAQWTVDLITASLLFLIWAAAGQFCLAYSLKPFQGLPHSRSGFSSYFQSFSIIRSRRAIFRRR
jgi:hypothetical protein